MRIEHAFVVLKGRWCHGVQVNGFSTTNLLMASTNRQELLRINASGINVVSILFVFSESFLFRYAV